MICPSGQQISLSRRQACRGASIMSERTTSGNTPSDFQPSLASNNRADCNSCHTILAQGSGEQLEKLNPKGYSFFHIDAINEDFSCNNCHTGAFPKQ